MASITPYETAQGKRYRVRYRKPDGRQTDKRGFTTLRAAEGFASRIEVTKADGLYIDPTLGKVTVTDWSKRWLDGKSNLTESTRFRYEGIITNHIEPTFGGNAVSKVRHIDVQEWISGQSGSPASVVKNHRVLSQILELAVKDGRLPSNPAKGVSLPKVRPAKRRYLTPSQVEALAKESEEWGVLILVLAYCALRWGEMAALKVEDVDMLRRRIHITKSVTVVNGRFVWGPPKDNQVRSVPIPKSVALELSKYLAGKEREDLLFAGPRSGNPLRTKAAREMWFDAAVKSAGCPLKFTPHELRHTAASLAVSAGANVKALQRMLGHAKASMTLDVYADLFDDDLDAVGVALDDIRARVV
ncbi:site-specific integrase [Williamsia sp.]|uniref:tyrosine-type recombinase/integrase n=1 Tax=Williamsia sp. TaxID=1872085 RepID=UPI002F940CE8